MIQDILRNQQIIFRNNFGSPFPNKRRFNEKLPIWWEFVQHVINTNPRKFDNHFKPIYLLCGTCGYQYNYILKFETIKTEEPYFIADIGATGRNTPLWIIDYLLIILILNCLDLLHDKWENSNKLNISDTELLEVYFEMLSDEEVGKLYKIYEADFKQFQYKFDFRGIKYN